MSDLQSPKSNETSGDLFDILDRADIDVRLIDFVALWYAQRKERKGLPLLREILTASEADTRDRYAIIEAVAEGDDGGTFRYREVGSAHEANWGMDIQGRAVEQVFPAGEAARLRETYERVLRDGTPDYLRSETTIGTGKHNEFERVIVPVEDMKGEEVIFAVVYWRGTPENEQHAGDEITEAVIRQPGRVTETLRIRVEIEGAPIAVENILSTETAGDEAAFLLSLEPMLRKLRSGLSARHNRHSDGMVRIMEMRLEVQVAASLSLMPLNDDSGFVSALAPYVEAFRASIVRAAQEAEARPGENREWRVRPRIQTFASFRLQKAALRLGRQMTEMMQERMKLSLPELRLISTLGQDGMQTVSDAADKTLMDRAQVSRTLSKLQKEALVDRFVDKHDRRVTWISLTEAGEALWEDIYPFLRARDEELTREIDREDLRVFYRVLDQLSDAAAGEERRKAAKFSFN